MAGGRRRAQAAHFEDGGEVALGVVAGGVELEGFADQRRALGIEGNGADFASLD